MKKTLRIERYTFMRGVGPELYKVVRVTEGRSLPDIVFGPAPLKECRAYVRRNKG